MKQVFVYTPQSDIVGSFRGSGRITQVFSENYKDFLTPITSLEEVKYDDTLFIPSWSPFQPALLNKRYARRQILMIFDVIPLKYAAHFPVGLRGQFNLWRNKRALRYFDAIVTISNAAKKDIVAYLGLPEEKVHVAYPALSSAFYRHSSKPKAHPESIQSDPGQASSDQIGARMTNSLPSQYCLYVGDVNWNKNIVNLARAIKKGDTPCVFVGKPFETFKTLVVKGVPTPGVEFLHPWQSEFKQFIKETENDKRFIFAGYVPDEELVTLYQKALCNILVSRDEGFGYSYAEAASQKCPSILSDTDIFHETAGDTALFANPENPDDIAEKIKQFASIEKLRIELGHSAYERIMNMCDPDAFVRQYTSIFVQ